MKTVQKPSKRSSKSIPDDYKSVDSTVVPTTTVNLSARTRSEQRKEVESRKLPEFSEESISRLAAPRQKCRPPENKISKVSKNALKYKASKRILSLAKPRIVVPKVSQTMSSQGSFHSTVSSKALKYIPTPRILELARPKREIYYTETQNEMDDEEFLF